ncbi:MAG: DUF1573 domain-containing protein [Sphingobacteriales bacterium]|nr:MAG: DUF1573 domain-containing protein [Sphingobacteriales bacterium]
MMKKPNPLHTVLLALAALSLFVIAVIEVSGISQTALVNKYGIGNAAAVNIPAKAPAGMPATQIKFEETHHSFGKVRNGDKVQHVYTFKNVGTQPLLITKVDASCGCTAPSFPTAPVAPGETGEITLAFNSTNRGGFQEKTVFVHSNAQEPRMQLSFDADVTPDSN